MLEFETTNLPIVPDANFNEASEVHMFDEITQNNHGQDQATMCDQIYCQDAEIQCDSILKRSIAVQTLAQRKPRKQKRENKTKRRIAKHPSEPKS